MNSLIKKYIDGEYIYIYIYIYVSEGRFKNMK